MAFSFDSVHHLFRFRLSAFNRSHFVSSDGNYIVLTVRQIELFFAAAMGLFAFQKLQPLFKCTRFKWIENGNASFSKKNIYFRCLKKHANEIWSDNWFCCACAGEKTGDQKKDNNNSNSHNDNNKEVECKKCGELRSCSNKNEMAQQRRCYFFY